MTLTHLPEFIRRYASLWLAIIVGCTVGLVVLSAEYSEMEAATINLRFRLRNNLSYWPHPPREIVYLVVNDAALEANLKEPNQVPQRWPWPRSQWAVIHTWLSDLGIKPAALVYDIVFDLADDSPVTPLRQYQVPGVDFEYPPTCDAYFESAIRSAGIPTFLSSLFTETSLRPMDRSDYKRAFSSSDSREARQWRPPPDEFLRYGIPFSPDLHGRVLHARKVSIPWDTRWWFSTFHGSREDLERQLEDLEFQGLASSLLSPASGSGMTTLNPEPDGVSRFVPLAVEYDNHLYPSLALQVALHYLGIPFSETRLEQGLLQIPAQPEPIAIPVDNTCRMLLNLRYEWPDRDRNSDPSEVDDSGFQYVNYWQLIDGIDRLNSDQPLNGASFDPRDLQDKIVIIGSSATATHDLRAVPIAQSFPMMGTLGSTIRTILQRDFIRQLPLWVSLVTILAGALLVGLLGLFLPPLTHGLATLLLVVLHLAACYLCFERWGLILDLFHVVVAQSITYALVTIVQYFDVSSLFGRYVTPEVRRYLMSNKEALQLGGQQTEVSVLFSDLKGFTSMSEQMEPREVITALNAYFEPMFAIVIDREHGTLDKLIGDAIMAYFGHPQPLPDHPLRAVRTALAMQRRLVELRERWASEGLPPLRMRIGVNTGPVVAGNMGAPGRTDYSIIGDTVNLASRLESSAPVDGVLVSEETYLRTKDHFIFREWEPISVKNKAEPVKVYEVLDNR